MQSKHNRATVSRAQLGEQLRELGVQQGGVLLVHCSFSRVRPVEDGPLGLIAALRGALGPEGTLVMPSTTDDDDRPFDPRTTSCIHLGIVADTFWRQPGVQRSDSPHAFAAIGPHVEHITAPHPIDMPVGLNSPVGRVYELGGQALLLGVNHNDNSTVHLAETLAGVPYRRAKYSTILRGGRPARIEYGEIDHCCQNFTLVDEWLDERGLQRKGPVGHAEARLMRSRDVVGVVRERLEADKLLFLHPPGVDEECDEALQSVESRP